MRGHAFFVAWRSGLIGTHAIEKNGRPLKQECRLHTSCLFYTSAPVRQRWAFLVRTNTPRHVRRLTKCHLFLIRSTTALSHRQPQA